MVLLKLNSGSPEERFEEKQFFSKKKTIFLSLSHIEVKKIWIFLSKLFSHECQNCILRVHSNNLKREIFVGQFLISHCLWTRSELFLALCRKLFGCGIQNCNLHIHRKVLRKILFFFHWRIFFFFLLGRSAKFISLLANFSSWVVNTAFYIAEYFSLRRTICLGN